MTTATATAAAPATTDTPERIDFEATFEQWSTGDRATLTQAQLQALVDFGTVTKDAYLRTEAAYLLGQFDRR